ncbi:MAG: NAD(P)/FAD-dependent oxidoreductase, partial [Planctomycetota bacterium]
MSEAAPNLRKRIVILGGGFGGAYCAQALERTLRGKDVEVVLFERHNYFIFYPLLLEAGTGSLEPRHAVVPLRAFLKKTDLRMADVVDVDFERRAVRYRLVGSDTTAELDYDHLVIALGSVTRMPDDVPGLRTHAYEIKSLADAVGLRDRAIAALELANATEESIRRRALLHFVVVGGSFTGAEVAGEFEMFLRQGARRYGRVGQWEVAVTLVERDDRILRALPAESVVLSDGETLDAHTVIWCAGIEQNPLICKWPLPADDRGYILCDRDLRVQEFENVWAIGDCAINPDREGNGYPATAQHAVAQAGHLARNLAAVLSGAATKPCDIMTKGSLAALGCRTGVAKVFGLKLSGFAAWWL